MRLNGVDRMPTQKRLRMRDVSVRRTHAPRGIRLSPKELTLGGLQAVEEKAAAEAAAVEAATELEAVMAPEAVEWEAVEWEVAKPLGLG